MTRISVENPWKTSSLRKTSSSATLKSMPSTGWRYWYNNLVGITWIMSLGRNSLRILIWSGLLELLCLSSTNPINIWNILCLWCSLLFKVLPQILSLLHCPLKQSPHLGPTFLSPASHFLPFTLTADIGYTGEIFPARCIRYKRSILYYWYTQTCY